MKVWIIKHAFIFYVPCLTYQEKIFPYSDKTSNTMQGTPVNIIVGSQVWVEDPTVAWVDGRVTKINGQEVTIDSTDGRQVYRVSPFNYVLVHFRVSQAVFKYSNLSSPKR